MFGYNTPSLLLLHALNSRTLKFDPTIASHASLLEQGLVIKVKGNYFAMSTDSMYEAQEFESTVKNLESFGMLEVVGMPEQQGIAVREFGVDLATGKDVSVETTHRFEAGGIEGKSDDDAPSFPATPLDPSQRPEIIAYAVESDFPGATPEANDPDFERAEVIPSEEVQAAIETTEAALDEFVDEIAAGVPLPTIAPEGLALFHHPESECYFIADPNDQEALDPLCVDVTGVPHHEAAAVKFFDAQRAKDAATPAPVEEPTPDIDDTLQWERAIGDLPQAFENLRPSVRLLVRAGLVDDVLFQKIYSAAFQAKEVARSKEFIKTFNDELPVLMNERVEHVAVWFESWLHDLTKRVLTFDGSEEVQAAFRAIMKLVPDDKKKDIQEYLQEQYINTGIGRFFPEAVRRYKEASARATIAKPVSWILKTAESIHEQAEKEMKRPPQADPALIEYAIDLMPPGTDRSYARERLLHRLTIGNGIAMDEILSAWETHFGGEAQPALRYSWVHKFLKDNGKLYLNTKEAITRTAKEIIWGLLSFVQHPVPEPIGAQTWMESNAAQIKWIKAAQDVLEDHMVEGEAIYLKAWNKFMDEKWAENKILLTKKEGE